MPTRSLDAAMALSAAAITGALVAVVTLVLAPAAAPATDGPAGQHVAPVDLPPWGTVEYYVQRGAELYAADPANAEWPFDPRSIAASVAEMLREVQRNDELRMRLPQEVRDSLRSVDPKEVASGLAGLRGALQADDGLNLMVPLETRVAMKAKAYGFTSPYSGRHYLRGADVFDTRLVDAWYDRESLIRSDGTALKPPGLMYPLETVTELCQAANREFVSMYPWMADDAKWLQFERACWYYHSESVEAFLVKRLPSSISDRCRALIDGGWVVKDDAFYNPVLAPRDMARALEESGGEPGAYDRIVDTDGGWVPQFTKECLSPFTGEVPERFHLGIR